ncbi:MAG TPA: LytTR family DNA-binding domain-containing protein [Vicinamibacteria bacterium]|nr:LytTR family DNA-binding domain-containing protein [Vicinamibacteria bacterium]
MAPAPSKALVHLAGSIRRVVDAHDIYFLEAQGDETDVRLAVSRPLRDVRSLGEVLRELGPLGFVRIHRNHAVHSAHVREIRPAASGSGWEVRLEPPVNKVLPVSRRSLKAILAAYRAPTAGERRR